MRKDIFCYYCKNIIKSDEVINYDEEKNPVHQKCIEIYKPKNNMQRITAKTNKKLFYLCNITNEKTYNVISKGINDKFIASEFCYYEIRDDKNELTKYAASHFENWEKRYFYN